MRPGDGGGRIGHAAGHTLRDMEWITGEWIVGSIDAQATKPKRFEKPKRFDSN